MCAKSNTNFISPYAFPGLPANESTKARTNYFLKKVKQAKQLYSNSEGKKKPFHELKCDRLLIALEEFTGVTKSELLSYSKPAQLADIRNVTISVAVRLRLGSLKSIADYFNRMNHSTVHTAAKKGQSLIKQDSDLNDLYKKLVHSVA